MVFLLHHHYCSLRGAKMGNTALSPWAIAPKYDVLPLFRIVRAEMGPVRAHFSSVRAQFGPNLGPVRTLFSSVQA